MKKNLSLAAVAAKLLIITSFKYLRDSYLDVFPAMSTSAPSTIVKINNSTSIISVYL